MDSNVMIGPGASPSGPAAPLSLLERAAIEYLVNTRMRGIDSLVFQARSLRASSGIDVLAPLVISRLVVTPELRELATLTRAAQDHQRALCDDAADAVEVIFDAASGPDAKRAAWIDLQEFLGGELCIDVNAMPPSLLATSSPEDVRRVDVPDYYESASRILPRRAWHDDRRVGWAKPYVKRALLRDGHRSCVRALEQMRHEDQIHEDVDAMLAASDDDASFEPVEAARADPLLAIGCDRLLNTLRSSPHAHDRELAADIEVWFTVGKTGMEDARYQQMRRRLKTPRLRAMAQRLGFERVPRSTEFQITGRGERKQIILNGAGPVLPVGGALPGWRPCYRTEDSASRW